MRIHLRPFVGASLLAGLASCATFKPIDTAQAQKLSLSNQGGTLKVCGATTANLPWVIATMGDGSQRSTEVHGRSSEDRKQEALFDAEELVWTADIGTVELKADAPGASSAVFNRPKPINRFVWQPPADLSPLLENDVHLNVAFKKNPSVHTELTLVPSFDCSVTLDYSGGPGLHGQDGAGGTFGGQGSVPGDGESGGGGGPGIDGSRVDVFATVIQTVKRGPLALIRVTGADGAERQTLLALSSPGVQVVDNGGNGGAGGGVGQGADGDQSAPLGSRGTCGGHGGDGGNGGKGGNGGRVFVHLDREHPVLEQLIHATAEAGAGGPAMREGGQAGTSYVQCPRPGRNGKPGRDGRPGAAGKVAVSRESLAQVFPRGAQVGSTSVQVAAAGSYAVPAPASVGAARGRGPSAPVSAAAMEPQRPSSPLPDAASADSRHALKFENRTSVEFCTLQAGSKNGRGVDFGGANLLTGKLRPKMSTVVSSIPAKTVVLRALSCDRKSAGIATYQGTDAALVLQDFGGEAGPAGTMAMVKMQDLQSSPFALKE